MEMESLFGSTRWDILKHLSEASYSPMELSGLIKTTSANVSQQLRLLELAGLVKSERTQSSEKGKPRVVYTLSGDFGYLVLTTPGFSDKRLIPLNGLHKTILRIMLLDDSGIKSALARAIFEMEPVFQKIDSIYYSSTRREIVFVSEAVKQSPKAQEKDKVKVSCVSSDWISSGAIDKGGYIQLYAIKAKPREGSR